MDSYISKIFIEIRNCIFLIVVLACNPKNLQQEPFIDDFSSCLELANENLPNIILFLADDFGEEMIANHIDQLKNISFLKRNGVDFSNCYSAPVCTPSRVELLTGKYPFRTGWTDLMPTDGSKFVSGEESLVKNFKNIGYSTAVTGKWHLSRADNVPLHYLDFGFDYSKVHFLNDKYAGRYFNPIISSNGHTRKFDDGFGPDYYNKYALDLLEACDPVFLYYAFNLPHSPFIIPPGSANNLVSEEEKYLAMAKYMDSMIGNVINLLESTGKINNSIIIFTSDNGTPSQINSRLLGTNVVGGKGALTEMGVNVPFYWYEKGISSKSIDHPIDFTDILPSIYHRVSNNYIQGEKLDGKSFIGLIERGERHKPIVYSQYKDSWMMRYNNLKYYNKLGKSMIKDITDDPFELKSNLTVDDSISRFFENYYDSISL